MKLYESEEALAATVAEFIAEGLKAGAPVVAIATAARREAIAAKMCADASLARPFASDQLTWVDAEEVLSRCCAGDVLDAQSFQAELGVLLAEKASQHPRARVHAFGEMVDLLWKQGREHAAIRLEELWTGLERDVPMRVLHASTIHGLAEISGAARVTETCRGGSAEGTTALLQRTARALSASEAKRRRLEAQVEELREQVGQATRAKDEFLAMLGHELRNPLAPISTALQLLRLRGSESRELTVIERQIEHLVRLVDDLLDVSRITRGKVQVHRKPTELAEIVARAIETTSPLLEQRRHRLDVNVPRAGLVADVDADRMTQVIANLLTNAAKYSETGSQITVRATRAGNRLRLAVRDEGVGIAPELLGSIFDLFVQQPQALDRARGGLGLGLVIVRSLVELHGGSVSVTSDGPGTGSEFVIELPAAPQQMKGLAAAAPEASHAPVGAPKRRVLVVDDNEDAAQLLADLLDTLGYEVAIANDGPSALELVNTFAPEIGLLDIGLPVMDGYELARQLRARFSSPRKLQLAAVTGYGQEGDRRRSEEAGFTRHLVKPVSLDALIAVVEQLSDCLVDDGEEARGG